MVNTFLISASFEETARALDYRRLGKQRVEAYQLYLALTTRKDSRWANHPAAKMWAGYEGALAEYMNAMIDEWVRRGYKNTMKKIPHPANPPRPYFVGWAPFHLSHRASLLRKDPKHYAEFKKTVGKYANHGYIWPHTVDPKYRGVKDPPLELICAPVQGGSTSARRG